MNKIYLTGQVRTTLSGFKSLTEFYHQGKNFFNETIILDFYWLEWIGANWSALLSAILYKLNKENNLTFQTDIEFLKSKFDVLLRNQFIKTEEFSEDIRESTIPIKSFNPIDKEGFISYINNKLMEHRGMPVLTKELKEQIKQDIIEIFCNINYHANTKEPFFICGQFYPKKNTLILTMVDIGAGFLPAIRNYTSNKINNSKDAILWTLKGRSTKPKSDGVPGGLGIKNIYSYTKESGGNFQIITGNAFWDLSMEGILPVGIAHLEKEFCGSTINLFFKCD